MNILDYLSPLKHFSSEHEYIDWWQAIFATVLSGFWSRVFACGFLALAWWFGVRKKMIHLGFLFLFFTFLIAYGSSIFKTIFQGG
jgi:hypothetical protein